MKISVLALGSTSALKGELLSCLDRKSFAVRLYNRGCPGRRPGSDRIIAELLPMKITVQGF